MQVKEDKTDFFEISLLQAFYLCYYTFVECDLTTVSLLNTEAKVITAASQNFFLCSNLMTCSRCLNSTLDPSVTFTSPAYITDVAKPNSRANCKLILH